LEIGLRLVDAGLATVRGVHAGAITEPALADYLGMGLRHIDVLTVRVDSDPVPALVRHLMATRADVILTGDVCVDGWGTGMTPYRLASGLGLPIVPEIVELEFEADKATALQARAFGARQRIRAPLPCIFTVSSSAPRPRHVAFARTRRGERVAADGLDPVAYREVETLEPARTIVRRLPGVDPNASPEARLAAISAGLGPGAKMLPPGSSPDDVADAILASLTAAGRAPPRPNPKFGVEPA
jgi:electron transfer flavoprotein beta subunit